jgi:hypothetical protein
MKNVEDEAMSRLVLSGRGEHWLINEKPEITCALYTYWLLPV